MQELSTTNKLELDGDNNIPNSPKLPTPVDVEYKPYEKIIIHEIHEIPFNMFKRVCKNSFLFHSIVSWAEGYLIWYETMHNDVADNDIVINNTVHIRRVIYCKHDYFPKDDIHDEFGDKMEMENPEHDPYISSILKYVKERNI